MHIYLKSKYGDSDYIIRIDHIMRVEVSRKLNKNPNYSKEAALYDPPFIEGEIDGSDVYVKPKTIRYLGNEKISCKESVLEIYELIQKVRGEKQ